MLRLLTGSLLAVGVQGVTSSILNVIVSNEALLSDDSSVSRSKFLRYDSSMIGRTATN